MKYTEKKSFLADKLRLFFTAVITSLCLFVFLLFARYPISLARNWRFFLGGMLVYIVTVAFLIYRSGRAKECTRNTTALLISILIVGFPVYASFLVFYFDPHSLPQQMWPYWIGSVVLAPVSVQILNHCLKSK
ncbi:MAG TPA: hypothetical protein VGL70_14330 [Candidatus Binatia bacterium]|jgi:hypothetical protein